MKYIVRIMLLSIVLAVLGIIAYAYFGGDGKDHEERLIGALSFVADEIEASAQVLKADVFYAPSIEMEGESDVWTVSGLAVIQSSSGGTYRMKYSAMVRNLCESYTDGSCWRLEALSVGEPSEGEASMAAAVVVEDEAVETPVSAAPAAPEAAAPDDPAVATPTVEVPAPQSGAAESGAPSPAAPREMVVETTPDTPPMEGGGASGSAGQAETVEVPVAGAEVPDLSEAPEPPGEEAEAQRSDAAAEVEDAQPAQAADVEPAAGPAAEPVETGLRSSRDPSAELTPREKPAAPQAPDPETEIALETEEPGDSGEGTSGGIEIEGLGTVQLPSADEGQTFLGDEVRHFSCAKGDYVRDVYVKYLRTVGDPPCSVMYEKRPPEEPSTKVIWHADNERGFCEYRAKEFVEKLRDMDWDCSPVPEGKRAGD